MRFRNVAIRNNVFIKPKLGGVSLYNPAQTTAYEVRDNTFRTTTIVAFQGQNQNGTSKVAAATPSGSVRITGNLFAGEGGILVPSGFPAGVWERWQLGGNTFQARSVDPSSVHNLARRNSCWSITCDDASLEKRCGDHDNDDKIDL